MAHAAALSSGTAAPHLSLKIIGVRRATKCTRTRRLTAVLITPGAFGFDREALRLAPEAENVEARPVSLRSQ